MEEVDGHVARIKDLRSAYRLRHSEYANAETDYDTSNEKVQYEDRIQEIKKYLKLGKDMKCLLRHKRVVGESEAQKKSCDFLIKEIDNVFTDLSLEFDVQRKEFIDDQIKSKKAGLPQIETKISAVANSIK